MIKVTKLDGEMVYVNEKNIQWIESLPDTAITFLGGARLLVRENIEDVLSLITSYPDSAVKSCDLREQEFSCNLETEL